MIRIPNTLDYIGYSGYNLNPTNRNEYYRVLFFNEKMRIINTALSVNKEIAGVNIPAFRDHFLVCNDTLIFHEAFNNTIYNVVNHALTERYVLKYKTKNIPANYIEKTTKEDLSLYSSMSLPRSELKQKNESLYKYTSFGGQWLEGDKYIFISSKQNGFYFFSLYSKNTCRTEFFCPEFPDQRRVQYVYSIYRVL